MANGKRLIDANALIEDAEMDGAVCANLAGMSDIRFLVDTQPTVDAVEVVHGRWEQRKIIDWVGTNTTAKGGLIMIPTNELIAELRIAAQGLSFPVRFQILDACDRLERTKRDNELLVQRIIKLTHMSDYKTNADRCVCCGAIIPEGQIVCPNCLAAVKEG